MDKVICLDHTFSTTKMLIQEKPRLDNKSTDQFDSVLFLPKGSERKGEGGLRTKGYFKRSYGDKPLISIITVVFNGEKHLEQTIQSVINQNYDNVEYIIIDGGSTDGTIEIVKKYEDQIDYWVSEKDRGIYDAMNKGLSLVSGDLVGFINADDFYNTHAIKKSIARLLESGADYAIGSVKKIPSGKEVLPTYPLNLKIYQGMMYPHIGAIIKKRVYKKVGLFDTQYKISADFDMAMRIHLKGFRAVHVQDIIGDVLEGGISAGNATKRENKEIAIKYGRNRIWANILYVQYRLKELIVKLLIKHGQIKI